MGTYFFKILFAMLLSLFHGQISIHGFNSPSHVKCIESERQALLNFKQGLIDEYGMLSTWTNNDCCKWKGIECNNQTGHVHVLDLRCPDSQYLTGQINMTSLIHLQNIEYLDLSNNYFPGSHIPRLMGSFTNLRYLSLSDSAFGGSIPSQLGKLTDLQYLDLSRNDFHGEIPCQLGNLSQLRYLDLQWNSLNGPIPSQIGKLTSLRCLRLGGRADLTINGEKWLTSLSSLTILSLIEVPDLGSCRHCIQMISELIPNLRELWLPDCQLSDENISSLFHSQSNLSILDLSSNLLTSSTFQLLYNYSLNLQILALSNNNLSSSIFHENFNFSSKLRELYLNNCSLTDKSFLVPSASIKRSLSSLNILDLSSNLLKSSAIFHWILNFTTTLRSLKLGQNLLEGRIPEGLEKVTNFLAVLDLNSNNLQGEIPDFLGNTCTLQELYLNNNNLSGQISSFINNFSRCNRHEFQKSLSTLYLSNNRFTGEIPKSIGLLDELEVLHLQENHLKGDINELHFTNLSKLDWLDLTDNSLSSKFATSWVPPFQVSSLGLGSCKLGPSFPSWLQTQSHLHFLDISDAGIDDFVPDWFWSKLQSITLLNMSCNSLKGTIPNLPIKHTSKNLVFLNSNQFEGRIPIFLSQADTLDLSKNKISDFNTFLCGKSNLRILDLSDNRIMGQLPDCFEHLNESLEYLGLSNNILSGKIPQSIGTLVNLQVLVLRNNSLTGDLPLPLKNCTSLLTLDVSENLLSGSIPSWIGESLIQLKILSLRVNSFFGSVPDHLCYLSQIHLLDLSRNNLSGEIPTCLTNFTAMMERSIIPIWEIVRERKMTSTTGYSNTYDSNVLLMWKGQEYVFWNPEIFLKSIDFSNNGLTGEIPKEVGYLLGLVSLNLARNNLHGEIPSGIGNLIYLDFLDLSGNHFSGKIPPTLSKIDGLGYLNLSNNDLSGRIPWEGHFRTFDASHFEGNLDLCGEPLNRSCPGDQTMLKPQGDVIHGEDDNSVFFEALYMSLGIGFFAGFWGLLGPMLLWQPWRITYLQFLNRMIDCILVTVEVKVAKCRRWLKG